ncbi:MAG: hypothetical protein M1828_007640 [Chrysothrix sp. TS-e1954]|nr:MAG: hypothetical protein M1828_007640 [Chrysothrix sp. TS-e1954]
MLPDIYCALTLISLLEAHSVHAIALPFRLPNVRPWATSARATPNKSYLPKTAQDTTWQSSYGQNGRARPGKAPTLSPFAAAEGNELGSSGAMDPPLEDPSSGQEDGSGGRDGNGQPPFIILGGSETATLFQGSFPTQAATDSQGSTVVSIVETSSQLSSSSTRPSHRSSALVTHTSYASRSTMLPHSTKSPSSTLATSASSTMSTQMKETTSPNLPLTNAANKTSSGLSTGARIAIGITVPLAALLIVAAVLYALYRRRQQNRSQTRSTAGAFFPGLMRRIRRGGGNGTSIQGYSASPTHDMEQLRARDLANHPSRPINDNTAYDAGASAATVQPLTPTIPTPEQLRAGDPSIFDNLREAGVGAALGRSGSITGIGGTTYATLGDRLPTVSDESRESSRPNTPILHQYAPARDAGPLSSYLPHRPSATPSTSAAPAIPRSATRQSMISNASSNVLSPFALPLFPFETPTSSIAAEPTSPSPPSPLPMRHPSPLPGLDTGGAEVISLHPRSTHNSTDRRAFAPQPYSPGAVSSMSSGSLLSAALSDSNHDGDGVSRNVSRSTGSNIDRSIEDTTSPIAPVQTASAVPLMQRAAPSTTTIPRHEAAPNQQAAPSQGQQVTSAPRIETFSTTPTPTLALSRTETIPRHYAAQAPPPSPPARLPARSPPPTLLRTTVSSTAPPQPSWPNPMPVAQAVAPELRSDSSSSQSPTSPTKGQGLMHRHTKSWTQIWQAGGGAHKRTRSKEAMNPREAITGTTAPSPSSTPAPAQAPHNDTLTSRSSSRKLNKFLSPSLGLLKPMASRRSSDASGSEKIQEEEEQELGPESWGSKVRPTKDKQEGTETETALGGYWKGGLWYGPLRRTS